MSAGEFMTIWNSHFGELHNFCGWRQNKHKTEMYSNGVESICPVNLVFANGTL